MIKTIFNIRKSTLLLFATILIACKKDDKTDNLKDPVSEDVSFYWNMESLMANIYSGSGVPKDGNYELVSDYAYAGDKSLLFPGVDYEIAEFITDDQTTPEFEQNPDFDFDEGTVQFCFRYNESAHWIRRTQLISLKNELEDPSSINVQMHHEGRINVNFHHQHFSQTCDNVISGSWHMITLKWKRTGVDVNLYLQVNDDEPLEESFTITNDFANFLDNIVETQILVGNDTHNPARFYIDELMIWKVWK